MQVAQDWKVLAGLRWDHFNGTYRTYSTAPSTATPVIGTQTANRERTDTPWSKRAGLLYQPTDKLSFHFSYGTSFNTSGDTYQYDTQTVNTPPESSENLELGAKIDLFDGNLSTRLAAFRRPSSTSATAIRTARRKRRCSRASATRRASSSTSPAVSRRAGRSTAPTRGRRSRGSTSARRAWCRVSAKAKARARR